MKQSLQGPYFSQHVCFRKFHPENLPSAKKRHDEQTLRVSQVLDSILEGKEYLFGNKFTYADLVFIPWNHIVEGFSKDLLAESEAEKYPNFSGWHNRLVARSAARKVYVW
ncbi:Glutathione S-transferase, protein [Metarhizium guizhouense ARSEF 977]|uniref:Glutathione S-transferase, protein n=1 Tax=Metarhizium guizhouense (strain ARSEF 977) TaxID=1276136 RepID=A0A0B4H9R1_METGA|nr:Glutathione S-transferase, protein [Metarhizium guizhouense ARSEF 977]